jgi:integrase
MNSIKRFYGEQLEIRDINLDFIDNYVAYLKKRGSNDGGVKFFIRHFKAILNMAYQSLELRDSLNPFQRFNTKRFNEKPVKMAMSIEETKAFINVDLSKYPHLEDSHSFALFSFYCRGMNFVDILKLKWSNINGGLLSYNRSKTGKTYSIAISKPVKSILNKFTPENKVRSGYVFPLLKSEKLNAVQFENARHRLLRNFNTDLKSIAEVAGIKRELTSYVIRHTYATLSLHSGVSTDIISEAMGHSSQRVTKNYLKDFGSDILKNADETLIKKLDMD